MSNNSPQIRILDKYPGPIGVSTNIGNPNQLFELETKIREGFTAVEVGAMSFSHGRSPGAWSNIPKQIWEEVARLARLNNVKLSIHAPIQDLQIAGFSGNYYAESFRKDSAFKLASVLQTAGEMANIYGDTIKVNVHAGEMSSAEWDKEWETKIKNYLSQNQQAFEDLKQKLVDLKLLTPEQASQIKTPDQLPSWVFAKTLYVTYPIYVERPGEIPKDVMGVSRVEAEEEFDPVTGQTKIKTVVDSLYEENKNNLSRLFSNLFRALYDAEYQLIHFLHREGERLTPYKPQEIGVLYNIFTQFENITNLIDKHLKAFYTYVKNNNILSESEFNDLKTRLENVKKYKEEIKKATELLKDLQDKAIRGELNNFNALAYTVANILNNIHPKIQYYRSILNETTKLLINKNISYLLPVPEVAPKFSKKTVQEAYERTFEYIKKNHPDWLKDPNKLEKVIPTLTIENSYAGLIGTRPDEMIKFVENSREALREAINKHPEIKKQIEKKYGSVDKFVNEKIGACLDIAHLKGFIQKGYSKDDLLNWIRQVKPYIKHVHAAEAMYGEDTHMIPGMDWSDITKAELEELRDVLSKEGVYMIQEIGGWYQNFYKSYKKGLPYVLEMMGYAPGGENSYYSAIFRPEYFGGWPTMYSTIYTPQIQVTQYSPFSLQTFSMLPPHLGGKVAQTFSGQQT